MNIIDTFYVIASVVLIVCGGLFSLAMYQLFITLKTVHQVAEDLKDTTRDISSIRQTLKVGAFSLAGRLFGSLGSSIKSTIRST